MPLLGLQTCRRLYQEARILGSHSFVERTLAVLRITPSCLRDELTRIPRTGALIVASNHPRGIADGLVLASLLGQVRDDVRILANHLLAPIPELHDLCFFVDPFGGRGASARSQAGLRAALKWLRQGGALIMFPAGEVAHEFGTKGCVDSAWSESVGRLALATGAHVVPAFIAGQNSRLFYAAGQIHPALRTLLLARELLHQRGQSSDVTFGAPLTPAQLGLDAGRATTRIRTAVGRLDDVAAEIEALPGACRLLSSGAFDVYCAEAPRIPAALREIGRLREVTFQSVGEGTGHECDLDAYDGHYLHLFVWDRRQRCIVGAYRIGRTDHIVAARGVSGLYTRSLFEYDGRLLARMSPALELGRSFVRAEYQKNYNALLLLWKGIARFVLLHPEYRVLFGPVSISARYSDMSRCLLMAFLEQNHREHQLAELVTATNQRTFQSDTVAGVPDSIDALERLVAGAERGGAGVPVLLRQYLKLNARVIGFNVDRNFRDVLDALMMVDLTKVDGAILSRYFGREEAAAFLARHASRAA